MNVDSYCIKKAVNKPPQYSLKSSIIFEYKRLLRCSLVMHLVKDLALSLKWFGCCYGVDFITGQELPHATALFDWFIYMCVCMCIYVYVCVCVCVCVCVFMRFIRSQSLSGLQEGTHCLGLYHFNSGSWLSTTWTIWPEFAHFFLQIHHIDIAGILSF